MKVLITGGAGYIGSHTIIEILTNLNWEVISVDNFLNSSEKTYQRIEQITGKSFKNFNVDLTDLEATETVFEKIGQLDGIIHFAALKAVGESVEHPIWYYKNNLESQLNILKCCKKFKVPNLIFSSSCSIYGNVEKLPVNEQTPFSKAESPYASTKVMGEEILEHFSKISDTNLISLRYFNPVGAHKSGLNGENPINKPNNLVPVITQFASNKIENLTVFGSDYKTRDGSCVRDYIHVSDIADAHILALEYGLKNNLSSVEHFNLGTGNGVSVLEAIEAFERVSKLKLNVTLGDRRPGDVESIYSDSSKANNVLNWQAKRNIDEMMLSAWQWQLNLNNENND